MEVSLENGTSYIEKKTLLLVMTSSIVTMTSCFNPETEARQGSYTLSITFLFASTLVALF